MTSNETAVETRKIEQRRPPALDGMVDVNKPGDKAGFVSHHHQQSGGRPPHAPYSSRQQGYSAHYPGYPGATRPPQLLQSVVTSSFSAGEEDRDPSHRGASYPPVPRHVNICINQSEKQQQPWGGPPEERGPPEQRVEQESRDPEHDSTRQQPPTTAERPAMVPPSPARSRFPPLSRGSGSASSSMGPPEPLKRSFWHHSRPNEELNSSLPPDFIPPKRTKVAPAPNMDMRESRRPPSFFNRDFSWDSRGDEGSYYHHRPPPSSPRYSSDQHGNYNYGGPPPHHHHQYHHSGGYREDEYDYSRARSHPPTPRGSQNPYPHEGSYHNHHYDSPSHAAAAAGGAASHNGRRWGHHDGWQSSPRYSPTNYHQSHHSMQYRDDVESNRGWSQGRGRDPRDDPRNSSHFDGPMDHERAYHSGHSSYYPSSYYGGTMPPLHQKMPPLSHSSPRGGMPMSDSPSRSQSMDESSRLGPVADTAGNGKSPTEKDGPLLMLARPQDRISLSETLCVVREVSFLLLF